MNGRGPVYAAYSFIRVKDNSEDFDIMDPEELEAIRKQSKTYNPKTDTNEVPTSRDLIHTTEANEETAQ